MQIRRLLRERARAPMTPTDSRPGSISESSETRCGNCGAPIMVVRVQTDLGLYWGAVELWCGSYWPHVCPQTEAEGVTA